MLHSFKILKLITLYPSNWLYNAGVIGFLRVLESCGENVNSFLRNDGIVEIDLSLFNKISIGNAEIPRFIKYLVDYLVDDEELNEWKQKRERGRTNEEKYEEFKNIFGGDFGYKFVRAGNKLFASQTPFQNLVQLSEWQSFEFINLISKIPEIVNSNDREIVCGICGNYIVKIFNPESKLEKRLSKLQITHLKELGPSLGKFPNAFWQLNSSLPLCLICVILILCHRESLISLSKDSKIFINAPSFEIMWHINKYVQTIYGKEAKTVKEILGMSLIELAIKLNLQFGRWTSMNIEVVSKYKDKIDFFFLPSEIIQLLSDRIIASLLYEIGEFKILNMILDGKFNEIIKFSEMIFRIALKPKKEWGEHEEEFIEENVKLEKNKENLILFSQRLFELYAMIEEKMNKKGG